MAVYLDRKYLLLISSLLRNFKQKKDDLFNFSCPYCGDSVKNKLKARGYIFRKNNDYFYVCHNCQFSTTFNKFLKHIDASQHAAYIMERYSAGENGHSGYEKPKFDLGGPKPGEPMPEKKIEKPIISLENIVAHSGNPPLLQSIYTLPPEHYARQYVVKRHIPEKFWKEIFFTEKFKDFLDTTYPDHGKEKVPNDDRIVLCYTNKYGHVTNVAGRSLSDSKIRYLTVKVRDEKKLFGLHRVSTSQEIYVLEGQFDSFFVPNSVASGDSNLGAVPEYLDCDCTLIFDNEPRNLQIVKQINAAIENGHRVVLFPDTLPYKDINEMIMNGMTEAEVLKIIEDNKFQGLTAKLKFSTWRKC